MNVETTRWFDENGKEIIHELSDNLECIAEISGDFEEFSIGISFYSENLYREEITSLLGNNYIYC